MQQQRSRMQAVKRITTIIVRCCILYGAWLMVLLTIPYLAFRSNIDFLLTKQIVYPLMHWRWSFYVHVFTGVFVLLTGLVQFSSYIIRRYKRLHRACGYVYVALVLGITGPAGLVMAFYANGGIAARASFVLLSIMWIVTTLLALRAALQKRFIDHGGWMMRSYALTLSAITLRFYTYLIGYFQIDISPVHAYILVSWLSWTLNLIIAELLIRRGLVRSIMKAS